MTVESVLIGVLDTPEAKRTGSLEELAALLADALSDADLLAAKVQRRCRSVYQAGATVERFVRCTLPAGHDALHSGQTNATTTVTWTDEQAAGVLRERTA